MPLASSGLSSSMSRQLFRAAHNPPNISSARSLHTPSFVPRGTPPQSSTHRTRTILNAFVGHFTTPGTLRASTSGGPVRSMQSVASRMPRATGPCPSATRYPCAWALRVSLALLRYPGTLPKSASAPHGTSPLAGRSSRTSLTRFTTSPSRTERPGS